MGATFFAQHTKVRVLLPAALAEAAVIAWRRDDLGELSVETQPERVSRHRAGMLALIGLAVESGGRTQGGTVSIELDSWIIGSALEAAEDAGMLQLDG